MPDGRRMSSRPGPVPIEFVAADADGHVIDTRDGGRLVARGAVSWPEGGEPQGQGWYHPAALIPPGYGGERTMSDSAATYEVMHGGGDMWNPSRILGSLTHDEATELVAELQAKALRGGTYWLRREDGR